MSALGPNFFTQNRKKLIESLPEQGIIIVAGNGLQQRNGDSPFTFRQDSSFYYLTGIEEPCATLVIDMSSGSEWIMLPIRTGIHAIFDGAIDEKKISSQSGINEFIDEKEGFKRLRLLSGKKYFAPQKPQARTAEMYINPHRLYTYGRIARILGKPYDIRSTLAAQRMIKSKQEISIIHEAAAITLASIQKVTNNMHEFSNEKQIEAELTKQFLNYGATGHAFQPIIASANATCTLHYNQNNAQLQAGEPLLFDIGAELHNYAADISRTIIYKNSPTTQQQEVIHAVKTAQAEIIKWLRPGCEWSDLAKKADDVVSKHLVQLGLLPKKHTKTDIRTYFPHAVSHFLGLDVHDVGDYSLPLAEGMVITVEPGIYIQSAGIGVRFEDDVVITKNGAKILGLDEPSLL